MTETARMLDRLRREFSSHPKERLSMLVIGRRLGLDPDSTLALLSALKEEGTVMVTPAGFWMQAPVTADTRRQAKAGPPRSKQDRRKTG